MLTKPPSSISNSEARARLCFAVCLCLVLWVVGVLVHLRVPLSAQSSNRYITAAFDKRAHLTSTDPAKGRQEMLLFGGSSVAFSISAAQVSGDLQQPVYNLGLQAGLGLEPLSLYSDHFAPKRHAIGLVINPVFLGQQPRLTLPKCDLVFLRKDIRALMHTPGCLPVVLWRQLQDIRDYRQAVAPSDSVYQRGSFNAYGDVIAHLGRPATTITGPIQPLSYAAGDADSYIARVKSLTPGMERAVLAPPASRAYCDRNRAPLEAAIADIHAALDTTGHPPPPLICIDNDMHFDGQWHLAQNGRRIYSDYIAQQLAMRWAPARDPQSVLP